ncbi:hypothetical protein MMUR_00680 [Mycolicibacterium murale]|uniref:Uncharacterized protein n=1 Tax=Mycolicibacterium murale TaxID=182220 RepID=A0A7I9WDX3_9MYCO|nr:hypothetical protein MMUR_00680 [Mycolicibacterium murale]
MTAAPARCTRTARPRFRLGSRAGGLDRATLHSQLARRCVLLHVSRKPDGSRQLNEIALLERDDGTGTCRVRTAWHAEHGRVEGFAELRRRLDGAA